MIVTSLSNPYQDTRSPEDKFFSELARKKNDVPDSNSSSIFQVERQVLTGLVPGTDLGNKHIVPDPFGVGILTLPTIKLAKLSTVRSLKLSIQANPTLADGVYTSIADYSVDLYVVILERLTDSRFEDPADMIPWLCYPIGVANWVDSLNEFQIVNTQPVLELSDTIPSRRQISPTNWDFSNTDNFNSNSKITQEQYNKLIGSNTLPVLTRNLVPNFTPLTAPQQTHAQTFLPVFDFSLFFTYFGLMASYTPINS
jgi:hypothetical protein